MKFLNNLFKKPVLLVLACLSVNFVVATVVTTTTPTTEVNVQSYDYTGTTFSGKIYVSLHICILIAISLPSFFYRSKTLPILK